MTVLQEAFFALSILIAGVIGLTRFGKISRLYYPFVFFVWIAGINEILNVLLVYSGHYTTINSNIYVLAEAISFCIFFRNMGLFKKSPRIYYVLLSGFVLLWVWENFLFGNITYVSSWFRIVYSFCIVLMSITSLNKLILLDINRPIEINNRHILKNPIFLICIGAIFYFTYKVLVEIFWLYGLNSGKEFRIKVYDILVYINLVVNLIYALAVLWVPPKQTYMTQY